MKKTLILVFAVVLGIFLVGCSKSSHQSAQKKAVNVMIGYENNPGEPIDLACQKWKEYVEQESKGSMTVTLYPSSQLGTKDNIIDQAVNGEPVITLANGAFFQDRGVKDFGIVFAPYLFGSWDDFKKLMASDWWKQKCDELEKQCNLKILTSWNYGVRHTITKAPVKTPEDLKGKKIRVPNNVIQVRGTAALGATPTPMSLGDVYTALQQGVIDGLENPLPVILNGAFQEVAKYLILDGHIYDETCWITGTKFYEKLSPEQQKILVDCGNKAGVYNNQQLDSLTQDALNKLKDAGVVVTNIDLEAFRKASESFYSDPEIKKMWSPDIVDTIRKIIK
ncbi:DctP family TRAP transporter solute-binding subunit [Treponema parvum]|uniref:DctP family TRAP transporter solute-binding subunit n=1 Tax=Treponema parvum TaxID=138851 RepID=A0A975F4C1_9SPIR|nr:C4-dicarboxylate TRAP transporter substrate-binding protein [Treponema parvum]QTQ11597.1 DctP family TRAP transporter solute-binding subunit [Treponema parvum]QTQ14216.1 DctP family TRAP transporter solute-binding subunit [Treponema parvum]